MFLIGFKRQEPGGLLVVLSKKQNSSVVLVGGLQVVYLNVFLLICHKIVLFLVLKCS